MNDWIVEAKIVKNVVIACKLPLFSSDRNVPWIGHAVKSIIFVPVMKQPVHPKHLTQTEAARQLQVSTATVSNWVREGLLEMDDQHRITLESLRRFQLKHAGKTKLQTRANKLQKDGHDPAEVEAAVLQALEAGPFDDALGVRYQAMLSESFKNKEGIFYTPEAIVDDMMKDVSVAASTRFLDPCCGTGNFLVSAVRKGVSPDRLYGFDTDANAVRIAQRRIKELTGAEAPHVVCCDFLEVCSTLTERFDLVFTNPPWGKKLSPSERLDYAQRYGAGSSADTCSLFLLASLSVLNPGGIAGLLMPESFFKIAVFEDARRTVLQKTLLQIKDYGKPFKNMYSAVSLVMRQQEVEEKNTVICHYKQQPYSRRQAQFLTMPRCNINYWTRPDEMQRIEALMRLPHLTLKGHATWGMGIVTGNNGKMCKRSPRPGLKPVYRGKDILPGRLTAAHYYINPNDFPRYQQLAPLALYHAPEKLVYRFISSDLVFYCDARQRYILNSANMLVLDKDFPLTAKQLAKVMNSPLTNWLFKQLFHTHKVLRGDLECLPLFTESSLHGGFDLPDLDR